MIVCMFKTFVKCITVTQYFVDKWISSSCDSFDAIIITTLYAAC